MGRWIGIDYGTRHIGLATADPGAVIASPTTTLSASGNAPEDARRILEWAAQNDASGLVVGLPLNMDGSEGPQARLSREFARQLERLGPWPVRLWDERLSSFQADQVLDAAQVRRSRRKRLRDALAAQFILQSFLDARRAEQSPGSQDPPAEDEPPEMAPGA